MKRVLFLIETKGPGGAETVVVHLARHMDPSRYQTRVVLLGTGWLHEELQRQGVDVVIVPSERSWDIGFLRRLMRAAREFKADLIHAHLPGTNLYGAVAAHFLGIPSVVTYHGELHQPGYEPRFAGVKNYLVKRWADRIVLVADYLRHDFVSTAKFPPRMLSIIYNGIPVRSLPTEPQRLAKRSELGLPATAPVVGVVANIRRPKGYQYWIEAAALISRELPEARFVVVGQGSGALLEEFQQQVEQYRMKDRLMHLGFRSDTPDLLGAFDLFMLSSISEGLPLAVVEAMAAGLPVVATRVGGMAELVEDGASGYLVPPANSRELAERALKVLRDPSLRTAMAERGRAIVKQMFSLEHMVRQYQDLYEKCWL